MLSAKGLRVWNGTHAFFPFAVCSLIYGYTNEGAENVSFATEVRIWGQFNMGLTFREATNADAAVIAMMNQQLIRDEGHRNSMDIAELTERMQGWLGAEYQAVVFHDGGESVGYALFRFEPKHVYLRQFFVVGHRRREGIGGRALSWMWSNIWKDADLLRLEVLVGNSIGRAFWASVGFSEYCVTMEATRPDLQH